MKRKGPVKYFLGQLLQEGLLAIRGLIIPNFLGPYQYGLVSALNIIERYSNFTNLGIHQNILYKVPYYRVRNDVKRIEEIRDISFSFTLLSGIISTLFIIGIAIFKIGRLDSYFLWGMAIMSLSPLLLTVRGVFMLSLRADKDFDIVARVLILSSVCLFVLVIALGLIFKAMGVLAAQIITSIIAVIFLFRTSGYRFRFNMNLRKVIEFLRFSIPIVFIIESLKAFLATIDKIMILKYLGTISVGFYSIGLGLSSFVFIIPASIATVANPTLVEEHGVSKERAAAYFMNITSFVTIVTAFFVVILVLLAPWLIKAVFPKYTIGIGCAKLLPFLVYFEGISLIAAQMLILCNRKKYYILLLILSIGIGYLLLNSASLRQNIVYVALAMVLVNAFKAIGLLLVASSAASINKKDAARFIGFIIMVSVFILLYPLASDYLFSFPTATTKAGTFIAALIKALLFCIIYIPFVLYFKEHSGTAKVMVINFIKAIKEKFISSNIPEFEE